jgi:hypothetical protein
MKKATAHRIGWSTYRVTFGKVQRECPYRFLLALQQGGWRVTIDQRDYRPEGERRRLELK